jgi:hypothetical protein
MRISHVNLWGALFKVVIDYDRLSVCKLTDVAAKVGHLQVLGL